jgi:hypothetical protein
VASGVWPRNSQESKRSSSPDEKTPDTVSSVRSTRGERVGPRVSRGDPSGRDLVESFRNSRGGDHTIAVPWSVPAFHFGHASVGPRPSDNGCRPASPSRLKGTAYDTVTGIVWCRWLRVEKNWWVTRTDLARSGCYWVGQVQDQATTPSLFPPSKETTKLTVLRPDPESPFGPVHCEVMPPGGVWGSPAEGAGREP